MYFSGTLLGEAFGNYLTLVTNGTGVYCTTAQEDNATLEALLRGALAKLLDFSRVIIMRTASDFDRPYAGESDLQNLVYFEQGVSYFLDFAICTSVGPMCCFYFPVWGSAAWILHVCMRAVPKCPDEARMNSPGAQQTAPLPLVTILP